MSEQRCNRENEFKQQLQSFDADDIQFTAQLIRALMLKHQAPAPARVWNEILPRRGWIVLGAEPLIIGADYEPAPPHYAPTEPMRRPINLALVPAPRIIDPRRQWPWSELPGGLRSDPGLVLGFGALLAAFAWWYWLAHGGESWAIHLHGAGGLLISMLAIYMPIFLSIAAGVCLVASIAPEIDFITMDLQSR